MTNVVDRRLNGKNKSAVNRAKFKKRYKSQIKEAVADAVARRGIDNIKRSKDIVIDRESISEPTFRKSRDANSEHVHPGNDTYITGDKISKPRGGSGSGGSASDSGEGEDDFLFTLSPEEFMDAFFEDLELPNNIKESLQADDDYKLQRAGFVSSGIPSNLNVIRSYKNSLARKIALEAYYDEEIEKATDEEVKKQLLEERNSIPMLEEIDLRYNHREKVPEPSKKAVIFLVMDVSGSMDQHRKDLAKRFFILLYLFIKKAYGKSEVVFVRHTTESQEVDELTFFYSRETGGTIISPAFKLINDIIEERYKGKGYNIYVAQASDGDNWASDNPYLCDYLKSVILPQVQYMFYLQVARADYSDLYKHYLSLSEEVANFSIDFALEPAMIYPVFRKFFEGE
jgi:uncharacterized sporulation protein YeaH/YhbH (DUF444 family)